MPSEGSLPATLRRSPRKAQRTFVKARDSAEAEYHDDARAARVGWSAVKHSFEKVGDHWEPKRRKGPSDRHAAGDDSAPTAGGVDASASRSHLYRLARRLDVRGRSTMSREQLVEALRRASARMTRRARS